MNRNAERRIDARPAHQRVFLSVHDLERLCPGCRGRGCCACYQTGWKDAKPGPSREEVQAFMTYASELVDAWPQWKRDALIKACGGH